ncbi:hypothetical protein StoSoilB5_23240 [Arthrobacter sp. StoSoilB5]|nr:hypothetical protein StoSoilB5_23240 [Arthrobacter sp. StoSoilB5]
MLSSSLREELMGSDAGAEEEHAAVESSAATATEATAARVSEVVWDKTGNMS